MSTYTIKHGTSSETVEIDTEEEAVSLPIFDLHEAHNGTTSWADVSDIEAAADYLVHGDLAGANERLSDLGMFVEVG